MKYNLLSYLLIVWLSWAHGSEDGTDDTSHVISDSNDQPEPTPYNAGQYYGVYADLLDPNPSDPSTIPTTQPPTNPTTKPTTKPTTQPTSPPTAGPTTPLTPQPTTVPTTQLTNEPTTQIPPPPTTQPTPPPPTDTTPEQTPRSNDDPALRPYLTQLDASIPVIAPLASTGLVDVHKRNVISKVHGPDEIKVFFRDCRPYMKDYLFGGPVCATDRRTYPNFMFMECLNYRRNISQRVKVKHEGLCWSNPGRGLCPMDPTYDPVCGTDDTTYVNKLSLECARRKHGKHHLKVKYPGECIGRGHCYFNNYTWEKPVCASTGTTVQSYRAIRCLRSVGAGVEIAHDGHCTSKDLRNALQTRSAVCRKLKREIEPFPVCASNGETFPSAAHVICYHPHLEIEFHTACETPEHIACKEAKRLDADRICKPVCGSDGKNYNSRHHLHCARIFKTYLNVLHDGVCQALDSPCNRLHDCKVKYEPVCASDGVTYVSPLAMECVAKYKKNGIEFRHTGPCLKNN